jgi:serine/threonine protein kinase
VLDHYLADLQAGRAPDRAKLPADYPELASQLEQCLAGMEFVHRVSQHAAEAPAQLGDFRIVREIGRGGMGVVYEAEQLSLKRKVALKILRFGAATDAEAMRRFQREAETVAALHHTNIVPVFAVGCEQGVHYYAMQYVEGRGLDAMLESAKQEGRLPAAMEIARWGLQAAEALAHAHQRGVIHRDIKPSNLLLDLEHTVWLTDFGLAKRVDEVTLTVVGALLGTPRYMSPEQASTVGQPIDQRTDIYSLGATLYELSTGRPAFDADTPRAVLAQIVHAEPVPPRQLRRDLPRDLETIILKCMAKEPARRYATAQEPGRRRYSGSARFPHKGFHWQHLGRTAAPCLFGERWAQTLDGGWDSGNLARLQHRLRMFPRRMLSGATEWGTKCSRRLRSGRVRPAWYRVRDPQ